jgi:methionine sulfoxide reductase heme-binding subunit
MTNALWYSARGTGVVALVLLTVVMVLGIGARAGREVFGLPRFAVNLIHRNAALIACVLIAIHVTTLLFDPYAQLHLINLIVPFTASYRPFWVGLGATTLDLFAAIIITSLLRHRLGHRTWRTVHWLAYAAWPIAWLHGIGSGTDRGSGWYVTTAVICAAAVAAALVWRGSPTFAGLKHRNSRPTVGTYRGSMS